MQPKQNIKKGYGLLKWKNEKSLRPIILSINSITVGSEIYLLKILKKFQPFCKFSINSSKNFKNGFQIKEINSPIPIMK
jgi:hypothetical protein